MKRHLHTFQFDGERISKAAADQAVYHSHRADWWRVEQKVAEEKARASGIRIDEHQVTGGKRIDMVIDPTMQSRLNECATKIHNHQAMADRFLIEAATYAAAPSVFYDLDAEDVVHWRLAGGVEREP